MMSHRNNSPQPRTSSLNLHRGFPNQSVAGFGRNPESGGSLRFSGASRHLNRMTPKKTRADSNSNATSKIDSEPSKAPLRFLRLMIQQIAHEQRSHEAALGAMERLGREVREVLGSIQSHFEECPASAGIFDFARLQRSNLRDVDLWLRNHLAPLAASRQRTLMIAFDPHLDLLPANILFSLIVEHLRKRIYDSAPGSRMELKTRLTSGGVSIEITEYGDHLPPNPITDDSTRALWSQVVRMLGGSIIWRVLDSDLERNDRAGSMIQIRYAIQTAPMFHHIDASPSAA